MSEHPNYRAVVDALTENPAPLIEWAAVSLVALGAKLEWDMDDNFDTTEGLVQVASVHYDLPSAGGQDDEALRFYGQAARAFGLPTDHTEESTTDQHGAGTCDFETCGECQTEAQCSTCGQVAPIVTTMNAWRACQDVDCPGFGRRFM